ASGGSTWSSQTSGTTQVLRGVAFTDVNNGWTAGLGLILHTGDGGTTWSTQRNIGAESYEGIAFPDSADGWAVGFSGLITRSSDGGSTWATQTTGTTAALHGVAFAPVPEPGTTAMLTCALLLPLASRKRRET